MIILNKSTNPQSFGFIAKSKVYDSLHITDESTNTSVEVTIDSTTSGDYVDSITATFDLVEDRYYSLELKNGLETVLKDRVFCTNQAHSTYSVNRDVYTENTTTNDYIVYE